MSDFFDFFRELVVDYFGLFQVHAKPDFKASLADFEWQFWEFFNAIGKNNTACRRQAVDY